jgi:hypothetical protein
MPQVFSKNMNATARGSIVMELIDPKVIQLVTPPPDISGLSLEEQAAPAPWLAIRAHADVRVAVEKCIERNPGASADEIAAKLALGGVDVNAALVAQQLLERRPRTPGPAERRPKPPARS